MAENLEDLNIPENMARALALLSVRTTRKMKILHCKSSADELFNLDLGVSAPTQDELVQKILAKLAEIGKDGPLPVIETALWMDFVNAPFLRCFKVRDRDVISRGSLLAMVRGEPLA